MPVLAPVTRTRLSFRSLSIGASLMQLSGLARLQQWAGNSTAFRAPMPDQRPVGPIDRVGLGQRDLLHLGPGLGVIGGRALVEIGAAAAGIGTDHQEIRARAEIAMGDPGGYHNHIAGADL